MFGIHWPTVIATIVVIMVLSFVLGLIGGKK